MTNFISVDIHSFNSSVNNDNRFYLCRHILFQFLSFVFVNLYVTPSIGMIDGIAVHFFSINAMISHIIFYTTTSSCLSIPVTTNMFKPCNCLGMILLKHATYLKTYSYAILDEENLRLTNDNLCGLQKLKS